MVKEEIKILLKCKKNSVAGQGCCEPRIEVIVKFEELVGVGLGSGGCKPRIEGIVKWVVCVQSGGSECMCK